jgi:hypothetical protein
VEIDAHVTQVPDSLTVPDGSGHRPGTIPQGRPIESYVIDLDTEAISRPCHAHEVRAMNQCIEGVASNVEAVTVLLDKADREALLRRAGRDGATSSTPTDHNEVMVCVTTGRHSGSCSLHEATS